MNGFVTNGRFAGLIYLALTQLFAVLLSVELLDEDPRLDMEHLPG
jgi:hypothetical protein